MKSVLHKAPTRGHANHGWLDTHHTFSFAGYYDPERMNFGVLRVLNDDVVQGGMGFGTHPHDNMEIISIPLKGELEHKDSMGNTHVIRENDIQVMSAGTGIYHSEYNRNKDKLTNFLQIWVFPNKRDVQPRYDQRSYDPMAMKNTFCQLLSPDPEDEGGWLHQEAWFHRGSFDEGKKLIYSLKREGNGVYFFILEGDARLAGYNLGKRDGLGVWDITEVEVEALSSLDILVIEVPMH